MAPSRRERMVRRLRKKIKRKTILRWARPRNTLQDILQGGSKRSLQRAFGGARGAAIATRPGRMRGMRARGVASGSLAMPRRRMASPQIERVAPAGVRALRGSAMSAKGGGKKQQKAAVSASFFVGNIGVDVGQLDTLKMLRLIHRQRRRLLHCFRRSLKRKPSLRGGKLSLRVTLSPKGRVLAAEVEEKEIPQRAVRCIKHDIRTWRYPRPKTRGQAVVHMPFFFAPNRKKVVLVPRGYRPWSDLMHETWTYPRQFPVLFYQRGKSHYARGGSLDMRETLFWHPHLITDARGEARFRFGLNDRISSFRIGVSGVGKGLFGVATQVIRATKPLSVSAVVPMEVSRGDIVRIPVVVQSRGKSDASLRLQVGVSKSLALLSSADAEKRISLIAGAGKRFLIAVRVRKFEGKGSLVLRLKSGSRLVDQLHKEISIRPRGVLQRSSLSGVLGQGEKLKLSLKLPKVSVRGLQGAMMFDVDPLQRLREGLDSMLREPHGCFEQTSSVHATNIMLVRYLKARGFDELELYRKSYEMLRDGYERFKSFERRKGGFSAFPNVPVSAVLTARALLLLHETRRVFGGVSNVWLSRIAWWLRSRRDGKGEYRLGGGELAYLKRSSHSLAIRQAYITYALGQVGAKGITVEMELLRRRGSRSKSVQLVALALLTTVKQFGRSHPATITLHKRLKSFQQRDGLFADKVSKVAYNALFGNQHDVEATALALLGMLRVEKHSTSMLRAVRALRLRREASGAYGSTFSTALTLQALAAYETRYPARFQGSLTVKVNGKRTLRRVFSKEPQKKREGALRLNVGRSLQTGRNEIRLHSSAASAIPYVLGASYYVDAPKTSRLAPIRIQVKSSTRRASLHRQVRLTVTLQNVRAQPQSMVMAQVAFPGGLRVQRWQIEQLMKQRKVDLIETQPRKLLLYWRGMKGRERKVVSFDLLAMVPGTFTAGPSQAYLYYRNEHRAWTRGFAITVVP